MADASFLDGDETPLHLGAADQEDLNVISTLVQDSVLSVNDFAWDGTARRLAILLNRFRWEDDLVASGTRPAERVRSLLLINDALAIRSDGIDRNDPETVLSLLSIAWQAGEDGTGIMQIFFAGDGVIEIDAESINMELRDVTRPYEAPSGKIPQHPL